MTVSPTVLYDTISAALERPDHRQQVRGLGNALNLVSAVLLEEESIRFPSLFSRLSFLCKTHQISRDVQARLHQLRIHSRNASDADKLSSDEVLFTARALAVLVHEASGVPMPDELNGELGRVQRRPKQLYTGECLKVFVTRVDEQSLVVTREDGEGDELVMHLIHHTAFAPLFSPGTLHASLSLVDVDTVEHRGNPCLKARLIVYEPDYLVDVSSLAMCCMNIARHDVRYEGLWFVNRYEQDDGSEAIFLGNLVNGFFDRMVNAPVEFPVFADLFRQSFSTFPLDYLVYFIEDADLIHFMKHKALVHYENLVRVIDRDFGTLRPPIPRAEQLIEPSFMSPDLGLQGRLDLLHLSGDSASIVELKSGKLPWPEDNPNAVNATHVAQAHLYQMLVNRVLGVPFRDMHVYLLYSIGQNKGSNLRYVARSVSADQQLIALRNAIVMSERAIGISASPDAVIDLLRRYTLAGCGFDEGAKIPPWFAGKFSSFQKALSEMDAVERDYFGAYTSFIAREQWLARMGDGQNRYGHSALWRDDLSHDRPDVLGPLVIEGNELSNDPPRMTLRFQNRTVPDHDFRRGDICVLYPRDNPAQNAVSQQVIKGYVVSEPDAEARLVLGFRNPQHHQLFFEQHKNWYIEHDYFDQSFVQLQRELFQFMRWSDKERRALLFGQRAPAAGRNDRWDDAFKLDSILLKESREELRTLLNKALNAPEYFLLVGPPGTGKTSLFLANFIRAAVARGEQLLLLAYTNRAVDEICEAVESALGDDKSYFRIGSSSAGDPRFEKNLLHKLASDAASRKELMALLEQRSVVVSTVSGILSRSAIFNLKRFDRMVVDEASQVIEPLLINLLMRVPRFVLIGDDRQLPAVVQQSEHCNRLITEPLRSIGLTDLRSSLFERLLRNTLQANYAHCIGALRFQGRMHPVIGRLVGELYYNNALHPAGNPHQDEPDQLMDDPIVGSRLLFIEGGSASDIHPKVNPEEAQIAAELVRAIVAGYGYDAPEQHIGVIAPYRNQIGRIRQELLAAGVPGAAAITVDTVERFQGSQRDHIIYCTTVTTMQQLRFLTANTLKSSDGSNEVDRKLNVAISRARKQFAMIGQSQLLCKNRHYAALIQAIRQTGVRLNGAALIGESTTNERTPF